MVKLCIFKNCSTNSCGTRPRHISLHRFPANVLIRTKWENWVRQVGDPDLENFTATKSSDTICCRHFLPSDYKHSRLTVIAVPSIIPEELPELPHESSSTKSSLTISSVCSLAEPGPSASQYVVECNEPVASGSETPEAGVLLPENLYPLRLQSSYSDVVDSVEIIGETAENFCDNTLCYTLSFPGEQMEGELGTMATTLSPVPNQRKKENSSASNKKRRSRVPRKKKSTIKDVQRKDFDCPLKAQDFLEAANIDFGKTEKIYREIKLKYDRAEKKIQNLEHKITQLQNEKNPSDGVGLMQIKVCSNCNQVNICRSS